MKTLAIIALLLAPMPAAAMEKCCWQYDNARPVAKTYHHTSAPKKKTVAKKKTKRKAVAKKVSPTRVYEYVKEVRSPTPTCAGSIRGVGEQYVSESGAIERAIKSWQETVRYDLGESYMDTKNAQDIKFRCARSSIGEIAGQIFQRCEWVARPCRPALSEGSAPQ